jgi:hypothetical protein
MRQRRADLYSTSRLIFRGAWPGPLLGGLSLCLAPTVFRESPRREPAIIE